MSFWFGFFKNANYSFRFKLANFIMGDRLRNYLVVGCEFNLKKIEELEQGKDKYEAFMIQRHCAKIRKSIESIMH